MKKIFDYVILYNQLSTDVDSLKKISAQTAEPQLESSYIM